jgi:hypothetical protein
MASNVSLTAVRTAIRQRTHYESSQFVTDAELNAWINRSVKELYDLLVTTFEGYNLSTADNTIASGNTFAVPADFYKLLGVDYVVALPDQLQILPRIDWQERNGSRYGYALRGSNVHILPYSWAAGRSYRLNYVPVIATLVNDGDTFDGIDGYEEYVILDVCCMVLAKADRDASQFLGQKEAMHGRILASAHNRDAGEPPHVADVRQQQGQGVLVGNRWLYDIG